jgi:hypothetical protein
MRLMTPEFLAVLDREVCTTWPDCSCWQFLSLWSDFLSDEDKSWPTEDLEIAEDLIFIKLCCVQRRCPDGEIRAYVREQLRELACTRFRRHRVRCFDGAGGGSWRDGSLPASSSLRLCA